MKTDMERLYLDPPIYRAYQERLGDVRVLLMRACQSLSYIETESLSYGINLDIAAIDERRIANRPASHPFNMIVTYLNPTALEDFHNYESFSLSATRFDSRDTPHLISEPQGEEDVNMEMREQGSEADEVEDEDIDEDDDEDKDEDDEEDEDEDQINDKGDDDEDDEDSEEEDEEEEDEDDTKGDEEEEEGYQMQIERTVEAVDSNTSDDSPLLSQHSLVLPNHRNRHRPKGKPIQQHNLHPVIASYPWETVRGNEQMWSYQRTHYIITVCTFMIRCEQLIDPLNSDAQEALPCSALVLLRFIHALYLDNNYMFCNKCVLFLGQSRYISLFEMDEVTLILVA